MRDVVLQIVVWAALVVFTWGGSGFCKDLTAAEPVRLETYLRMVKQRNERILSQEQEWRIALDSVDNAEAIFEPEFVAAYTHEVVHRKLTIEDISQNPFSGVTERDDRNDRYRIGFQGLLPTGATVEISGTSDALSNEYNRDTATGTEYQAYYGISFSQPLLKNAGVSATRAGIEVAEADAQIEYQQYRQQTMSVVYQAALDYWELALSQEKHQMAMDSIDVAERILNDNKKRAAFGKMAPTEVLDAKAGLLVRRAYEKEAAKKLVSAVNSVRNHISQAAAEAESTLLASEPLTVETGVPARNLIQKRAFQNRPEYLAVKKKLKRAGIRVAYAENQRWPQLDLKGSYGVNGLDDGFGYASEDAWRFDYPSWTLGAELVLPLGGGKKTRSELSAAKRRKRQALLEMKAIEVAVINSVDTALQTLRKAMDQVHFYQRASELNRQLLETELARLASGKSNSRLVLEREEAFNRSKEAEIESLVNYKRALLGLKAVDGTLLSAYGIDATF